VSFGYKGGVFCKQISCKLLLVGVVLSIAFILYYAFKVTNLEFPQNQLISIESFISFDEKYRKKVLGLRHHSRVAENKAISGDASNEAGPQRRAKKAARDSRRLSYP